MSGFWEQLRRRREARGERREMKRKRRNEMLANAEHADWRSRGMGEVPGTKGKISGGGG